MSDLRAPMWVHLVRNAIDVLQLEWNAPASASVGDYFDLRPILAFFQQIQWASLPWWFEESILPFKQMCVNATLWVTLGRTEQREIISLSCVLYCSLSLSLSLSHSNSRISPTAALSWVQRRERADEVRCTYDRDCVFLCRQACLARMRRARSSCKDDRRAS